MNDSTTDPSPEPEAAKANDPSNRDAPDSVPNELTKEPGELTQEPGELTQALDASTPQQDVDASLSGSSLSDADTLQRMSDGEAGASLHWSTLWLPCFESLVGLIFPVLFGLFFAPLGMLALGVSGFVLFTTAHHVLRYFTFRYRLTRSELVLHSGIIHRRERRIPFDRVQETQIHQGLVHRLLDLARLEITTAGSDAKEANLNVISRQMAEYVKASIGGGQPALIGGDQPALIGDEKAADEYDYACQLSSRDLILGGLTSNLVASIGAVIATILYFQLFLGLGTNWMGSVEEDVENKIEQEIPGEMHDQWLDFESRIPDLGPLNFIVDFYLTETLSKSLALASLGLIGSVIAYMIRFHGFRLTRRDKQLNTSYGLLTLHRGSLSRDRIQALKVEEGLLRRPFRLASIRVDSAGDRQEIEEAKKRDVLVPVAMKETAHEVARQAIPGLSDLDPDWKRISRHAILRGSRKGWLLVILAVIQTYMQAGWYCLAWLPAFPLVYFLNERWFRNTGYWLGEEHFLSRKGWLNRSTVCLPIKNIQNVSVKQNYFDRRLGLATLSIDTAGQSNTGGGPLIRHLPIEAATTIQRELARRVGDCEFTW